MNYFLPIIFARQEKSKKRVSDGICLNVRQIRYFNRYRVEGKAALSVYHAR
jgi:hypothetical protein